MKRASPVDMRKVMEISQHFKQAGVLFVPMPVLNDADYQGLLAEMMKRLEQMESEAEANGPNQASR